MKYSKNNIGLVALSAAFFIGSSIFYPTFTYAASKQGAGWKVPSSAVTEVNALGANPVMSLRVPILAGVALGELTDTWGEARANGRTHEGIDILAPRGSFIVSPTDAVVVKTGSGAIGGNYVFTANAGGEEYYYAHLDSIAPGVKSGAVLKPGDLIGYVGNTGNASGGPSHLHFGIYKNGVATNPYPRLLQEFSLKERIDSFNAIVERAKDRAVAAANIASRYGNVLKDAKAHDITLGDVLSASLTEDSGSVVSTKAKTDEASNDRAVKGNRNLTLGVEGHDVAMLQQFLIKEKKGPQSGELALAGATGYFGEKTEKALSEYQKSVGINPASGYFGEISRAYIASTGKLALL